MKDKLATILAKLLSRKFLLTACWFVLLFVCIIKDGDMINSGFAMVIAVTGAAVNVAYMFGQYIKTIKFKEFEIQLEQKGKKNGMEHSK